MNHDTTEVIKMKNENTAKIFRQLSEALSALAIRATRKSYPQVIHRLSTDLSTGGVCGVGGDTALSAGEKKGTQ